MGACPIAGQIPDANNPGQCVACPNGQQPNADSSACVCPAGQAIQTNGGNCEACPAGNIVNNGACQACPEGQKPNAAFTACVATLFFTLVVGDADFATLAANDQNAWNAVAALLQGTICADDALCVVVITGFTDGSVNIQGSATHTPGQAGAANIMTNLEDTRNVNIPQVGGRISAVQSTPTDFDLCTQANPCNAGQGDCDNDDGCAGALKCGINNCPAGNDPLADCCYDPTDAAITGAACDGSGLNVWSCCATKTGGCGEGEGDCDNDGECAGALVCGRNSCNSQYNTNFEANSDRFFPAGQADCCITAARALFYGIPSRSDLEEDFQNDDEPF